MTNHSHGTCTFWAFFCVNWPWVLLSSGWVPLSTTCSEVILLSSVAERLGMSDWIAFLPLGHSTCLFGSGETDCHSGLWSSLPREGGKEEQRGKEDGRRRKEDRSNNILCPTYMGITSISSPSLPLFPPAWASSPFLPPTYHYSHPSPLVSSPLTPEQAYVKFVPLVAGSCPCWFQQITGALAFPTAPPGSVLQVIASWRAQRMKEYLIIY